jgi:hypothetical protein
MNSFSQKELQTLIKLEADGKLSTSDLYKRCALKTVQKRDNYVTTAIAHIVVGVFCVGLAGTAVAPIFGALWAYSWFKSYKTRSATIRRINRGDFIDYLDEGDRISYQEDLEASLTVDVAAKSETPNVTAPDTAIGDNTRLNTVETTAIAQTTASTSTQQGLFHHVANNPKSSFFAAPARVGKGIVITGCIRMVQARVKRGEMKAVTFWAMTPKQDPKEHWYWETCNKFYNPDIENGDRTIAARGIYQFISEFGQLYRCQEEPTILIVDELTRLVGLLKGIKMSAVDPELFKDDNQSFSTWLVDKLILSASMSQSVGYYVWVATPSSTVGDRGFSKGDIDSLNIYTLATKNNLKFADGGSASFSAPRTEESHPVFARGYAAGYCHQTKQWYHVHNIGEQIKQRETVPVRLKNYWMPNSLDCGEAVAIATFDDDLTMADLLQDEARRTPKPVLKKSGAVKEAPVPKMKAQKPDLSDDEIIKLAEDLEQWIDENPDVESADFYERWNAKRKGLSRPNIRYLLTLIGG